MKDTSEFAVVTGAFSYTGKYLTRRLLNAGTRVRTITGHPNRPHEFGDRVEIAPLNFKDPAELVRSLRGASVLYNSYWVRFDLGESTFAAAIENSRILIQAAREAGLRRIVHLSIANPSLDSPLPYYSGKAQVEKAIVDSGLSYAILRPTVIFGLEDILMNNIAWFVRRLPIFAIPGLGRYLLQPIFVEDIAELAANAGAENENLVIDAVGPEVFTFEDLARQIASAVRATPIFVHVNPGMAFRLLQLMGPIVGDVILTREEIAGLMGDLLVSTEKPSGCTRFTEWLAKNAAILGNSYSSEIKKHYQ